MTEEELNFTKNSLEFIFNLFKESNYDYTLIVYSKLESYKENQKNKMHRINMRLNPHILGDVFSIRFYYVTIYGESVIFYEKDYTIEDIRRFNREKDIDRLLRL